VDTKGTFVQSNDPLVSIIIANFNGEKYLAEALSSALKQTLNSIEIIVIDDASTDASIEIANTFARHDNRVRVIARTLRSGPGGSRNDGLAAARGRWAAILDSDDMMHSSRLEELIAKAEASDADLCADDLLIFQEGVAPESLLSAKQRKLDWITAAKFISSNKLFSREPVLGYLKPMIRMAFLRKHNISYDPNLMIGEDYDLVVQLLAKGAKFRLVDTLGYFYRKHSHSISHRMSGAHVADMLAADARLSSLFSENRTEVAHAFADRRASIERAAAFAKIVDALKSRNLGTAFRTACSNPRAVPLLAMPVLAQLRRLRTSRPAPQATDHGICLISRQRLIGNTNGSSTYLIALAEALRHAGHRITLISPSPATFGRWPFLILRQEMSVFDAIHIRGSWKVGSTFYIAKDPSVALAALFAIAARLAKRIGIGITAWDRPAPYAVAAPWHREDQLFIARHAPKRSRVVLADYAFTTPAIPYALSGASPSAVIMHDFFSARAERFQDSQLSDSVTWLDQVAELRLLRQADAVIAIQKLEAAEIARLIPDRQVLLTPLACRVAQTPQLGDRRTLLFIGSNTAPNAIGLRWFLDAIWPTILREVSGCKLLVAGSVASGLPASFSGVRFLGLVEDLDQLYAEAGVVISPLTIGSGLKIKLVEALGQGKAIVATTVTTEGCDEAVVRAIFQRDEPDAFARAVIELLSNDDLRAVKAAEALDVARRFFSPEVCYGELLAFMKQGMHLRSNPSHLAATPSDRKISDNSALN
jgi:succinoglycan biosynthesis protein ExoO